MRGVHGSRCAAIVENWHQAKQGIDFEEAKALWLDKRLVEAAAETIGRLLETVRRKGWFGNVSLRKRGEKLQQLAAPERSGDNDRAFRVNLKHVLGEIETNLRDRRQILDRLAHGRRSI
jgi:hypothetical protein